MFRSLKRIAILLPTAISHDRRIPSVLQHHPSALFFSSASAPQAAVHFHKRKVATKKIGDWLCPSCNTNVFASKQNCFNCKTAKPAKTFNTTKSTNSTTKPTTHKQRLNILENNRLARIQADANRSEKRVADARAQEIATLFSAHDAKMKHKFSPTNDTKETQHPRKSTKSTTIFCQQRFSARKSTRSAHKQRLNIPENNRPARTQANANKSVLFREMTSQHTEKRRVGDAHALAQERTKADAHDANMKHTFSPTNDPKEAQQIRTLNNTYHSLFLHNADSSVQAVLQTYQEATTHKDVQLKSAAYIAIISKCTKNNQIEKALDIFQDATNNNAINKSGFLDVGYLTAFTKNGHFDPAIEIFQTASAQDNINYQHYNTMLNAICNDQSKARPLYVRIHPPIEYAWVHYWY